MMKKGLECEKKKKATIIMAFAWGLIEGWYGRKMLREL